MEEEHIDFSLFGSSRLKRVRKWNGMVDNPMHDLPAFPFDLHRITIMFNSYSHQVA